MSYQVFARKYRPRTFADVLGQEHVVRTLRNAIAQNRLAHAYLFVGPRGTGKTSTARIFAKALCAKGGPTIDFDPDDELSIEIAEGRCMDVLEIDGASNNGVEQVRELRDNVKFAPSRCRFKIYYIDEVHMLSPGAFNALLKTLEEPPPHVKFIFATTEANKILPTIISRCQRFDLRRIPNAVIAKHLLHIAELEGVRLDEKAAYAIGQGADGGMRDAQSMLDQLVAFCGETIHEQDVLDVFGLTSGESVARLARSILERDTVGALRAVYEQNEAGKDLSRLLADLIQHFRTLLVQQADPESAAEDLSAEMVQEITSQAEMASTEQLLRVVDGLAEVDSRMRWAGNKRLHFELGVITAVQSLGEVSISDVIDALAGGEGHAQPKAPAPKPAATKPPATTPTPPPAPRRAAPSTPPVENVKTQDDTLSVVKEAPAKVEKIAAAPVTPRATAPSTADVWPRFLGRVQEKRPLVASWLQSASLLGVTDRQFKIGFPPSESFSRDSLIRPAQLSFLESVAQDILGRAVKLEIVLDASLKVPENPPPLFESPAVPPPTPVEPAEPEPDVEPKPESKAAEAPSVTVDPDFYNDPLIQQAIAKFKMKPISLS